MALGFNGGQALGDTGFSTDEFKVLGAGIILVLLIPAVWFAVLRRRANPFDAAAIAATYGSVIAATFVVASQFFANHNVTPGGYLTVVLVLMESSAIVRRCCSPPGCEHALTRRWLLGMAMDPAASHPST